MNDQRQPQHMPFFRIWLCGAFRVERRVGTTYEVVRTAEWGGSSYPRLLLKALLCSPGRQARRDALLELLWPETEPEQAVHNFNTATSKLRLVLRPTKEQASLLPTENDATIYRLPGQEQFWVDADEGLAALKEVERLGRTSRASLSLLEQATERFNQGTFLDGEEGLWASGKRATIEHIRYRARLWLAEAYEQQGMPGQAEMVISLLLEEDPTDEDALNRLLLLLHRQGMTQKALRLYKHACQVFAEEGLEPTKATKMLAERLQDDHLHTWQVAGFSLPPFSPRTLSTENSNASREKDGESLNILRRTLLQQMFHVTGTLAVSPAIVASLPGLERLSYHPLQLLSSHEVTPERLQDFATLTQICRRLSEGNELQIAEKILWSYLPYLETLVTKTQKEPQTVANTVSQGYLLAASLVGHRNDLRARQYCSEQALLYGEIAQDETLQVAALRQLAATFDYLDLPHKVLQTYQRALLHIDHVPPLLRSCIYAALSGAYAQFQQKHDADHFIGLAYESFGEHQGDEPDFLRAINASQNLLIHWHGMNHLLLGQPRLAEKIFLQLDVLDPQMKLPKRIRSEAVNNRARMFIAVGDMEQACTYLEAAVKMTIEIGSSLRLREVLNTFQSLRSQWPYEKKVQSLGDLCVQSLINDRH